MGQSTIGISSNMLGLAQICALSSLLSLATSAPQALFSPVAEITNTRTGEVIPVNVDNLDQAGCLVGPSGERVCPLGAFGADGQSKVLARGNKGPGQTGSNGNAGPINAEGQAYDPAAETYKKQILAYQAWAERQVENAKNQSGTAGK